MQMFALNFCIIHFLHTNISCLFRLSYVCVFFSRIKTQFWWNEYFYWLKKIVQTVCSLFRIISTQINYAIFCDCYISIKIQKWVVIILDFIWLTKKTSLIILFGHHLHNFQIPYFSYVRSHFSEWFFHIGMNVTIWLYQHQDFFFAFVCIECGYYDFL